MNRGKIKLMSSAMGYGFQGQGHCALLWSKRGYPKTIKTPRSGDGGIDVVAIRGSEVVVIQCKSSSVEGRVIGWEAVKDVAGGCWSLRRDRPVTLLRSGSSIRSKPGIGF